MTKRKPKKLSSARPETLEKCWALIEALDKRIVHMHAVDLGVLSDAHRKELDAQNEMLEAEGEETLCVAEYLSCRLEDAEEEVVALKAAGHDLSAAVRRARVCNDGRVFTRDSGWLAEYGGFEGNL